MDREKSDVAPATALRLVWCDSAGLRRCRVLPLRAAAPPPADAKRRDREGGRRGRGVRAAPPPAPALPSIHITKGCMGQGVHMDCVLPASGLSATGEAALTPDPASLVAALPWWPAHAMAACDLLEQDGTPWVCCPRSALKRSLEQLRERFGLSLVAGFELEFLLLRRAADGAGGLGGTGWEPVDKDIYCSSGALDAQAEVLDAMVSALQGMGVDVVQWHKEAAPGQFEIATGPADALTAADRLVASKEAIAAVARRRGLAVSFVPKPMAGEAGSGCHVHLSLWKDGDSVMVVPPAAAAPAGAGHPALSATASAFFAGILSHLPALLPFTAPSPGGAWGSYARLQPGCWAGAFACWGWDNREAPLRATCPRGPASANVELKALDGTTNPYVALAAVAAAGALGLAGGAALPPPVSGSPEDAGGGGEGAEGAEGAEGGAPAAAAAPPPRLPMSLSEALAAWEGDGELRAAAAAALGAPLVRAFMAVRRGELEADPPLGAVLLRY